MRHLTDLTTQAQLTHDHGVGTRGRVVARTRDRQRHREVGAGLGDSHSARDAREHVVSGQLHARTLLHDRHQHREPAAVERLRDSPRSRRGCGHDERLHLDAQRTRALEHRGHDRTRRTDAPVAQEQRARVGHRHEPCAGHLEQAELIGRAESVFERAQHAQRVVTIAFERDHCVDDVLQRAGPRERTVFRHVPDQQRRDTELLRQPLRAHRTVAHLGHRPGPARRVGILHRLDGVDRDHVGAHRLGVRAHVGEGRVAHDE